jgi:acetyl-CoA carboxylase carboxyltransferase component
MGGAQASSVLLDIKLKQVEKHGSQFNADDKKKLLDEIIQSYENKSDPLYAAARLWIDEIIDPALTRDYISAALESANNNPEIPKFNVGVIQT